MCKMYCSLFLLVLSSVHVFSGGDSLLSDPCSMHDMDCVSKSTQQFLEKTSTGIADYDIVPIDPMIIPSLDFEVDANMGIAFHFKNLTVTGLKNQKISDFQMDTNAQSVVLKTKADLHVTGEINIEMKKESKTFSGQYSIESTVIGTAQYNYSFKTDDKGVVYFVVGPETISCESIDEPKVVVSSDLDQAVQSDPDASKRKSDYNAKKVALRKKAICHIAKIAYEGVVHNIRAAAKILPKGAFFTDV